MSEITNRIEKKINSIEKLHDKASLLCEEVKDLLEELRENNSDWEEEEDLEEDFEEEEDIDEEEDK